MHIKRSDYKILTKVVKSGNLWGILEILILLTALFMVQFLFWKSNMFRGASAVNLDAKGRLAIPTRYRPEILEQNQGMMICTVDARQPCLLLYPLKEWEDIEQKLLGLSSLDPVQNALKRVMMGFATECELDSAGRILLSQPLRQHAKLEKSIMLVGQLNKFEIWSEAQWNTQIEQDIARGVNGEFALSEALRTLSL